MAARFGQFFGWFGCASFVLYALPTCVMSAEAAGQGSFEPFQVIAERNIFSPTHSQPPAESGKPAQPIPESLVLVGVMSYEKGQFAFFDGSKPDYRKALKQGDRIGGCVLTEIASAQVKLKAGDLEFELSVGTRLLRENASAWKPGGKAEIAAPPLEIAAQRTQSPNPKYSGAAVAVDETLMADSEKYDRKVEKKLSKYLAGIDPEIKKDKHGSKSPDAFFGEKPRKPDKHSKHERE